MRIYENHVSVICGLGNEYESNVQSSSENKAVFQFLTGLVFFLSGLIFTNVHFLNRCLHIRLSYIHNHWLCLRKPWTNKNIINSQDSECGKSPTWLEKLFSIQNYTFYFFSFNRKMLSGYCLETLKVFDVGWQEIPASFTHLMKSEQFQCA